jgi:hypothetical protein
LTPQEEIDRGHRAKRLLEDPLIEEAFTSIQSKLEETRDRSKWNERDLREHIHMQLYMLKALRGYFDGMVRDGEFTLKNVNAEKTRRAK